MKKFFLLGAMALSALTSWAQTSPYAGNAVANGDEWYLYNVETGYWLGNNNHKWGDWTTRAQANEVGLDFKLEAIDGGWRIDPKYGRNNSMNSSNFYLDTNDGVTAWTFDEVACDGATKAYKIHTGDKYLGVVLGTNDKQDLGYQLDFDGNTQGTWVIVTREERLALASEEHPVEASFLIPNYDLGENNPRAAWHYNTNGSQGQGTMWEHNHVWETWNVTEMDAYTTCTNVPNGKYLVYSIGAYVPTGGSGMNANDYHDYLDRGSDAVHALAYANAKTAKMASIYSETYSSKGDDRWPKEIESGVWVADGWGHVANQCGHYNKYWSEPVEVVVTDGNLRVGVKMDGEAPGSSWVIFSGMRMKYLGEVVDLLTPALENLNTAITAAEAVDQDKLTDAAKAALADAIAAAQALTESTDIDAINDATTELTNVYNNVKDMNVTALKAAVEYMAGRDFTDAAASDVLANGMSSAAVNDALNGLKVRFKQHVADKSTQPTQFTKVTEAILGQQDNVRTFEEEDLANGLYIYNVGTGRWFCGGDDWGAHAAVGFPGIKVTLPADNFGSGQYNGIVTHLYNGNWGEGGKLNHNGYCDTGGNGWKFYNVDATQGIVTIARNGDNTGNQASNDYGRKNLVGFSNNTYMRLDTDKQGAENPNNQWIFVTEAQRDAMAEAAFATATPENPVDLTWKIGMPGFNQRERVAGTNQNNETLPWVCNHANYRYNAEDNGSRHAICERGNNHADFCIDVYGGQWNDAFSWTQKIENLAPGMYRVKVQGYNNRGAEENQAKLVANNESVTLRQANTETILPWVGRLADSTWEAVEYFENGLYWNEVECEVGEDGTLTIGVTSPSISGDHVVLFDNFRLEYIGEAVEPFEVPTPTVTLNDAQDAFVFTFTGIDIPNADEPTLEIQQVTFTDSEGVPYYASGFSGEIEIVNGTVVVTLPFESTIQGDITTGQGTWENYVPKSETIDFVLTVNVYNNHADGSYETLADEVEVETTGEFIVTGIKGLGADGEKVIYNIAGQKMKNTVKGVNIINGKKSVIK